MESRSGKGAKREKTTEERRFFISSLPAVAETFAKAVRQHWSIENWSHYVLDVAFGEDQSRIRKGPGPLRLRGVEARDKPLNERQHRMIHRLLEGFEGHLTSSKWAKLMKCSQDTASRDIEDLVVRGVLRRSSSGGRSTHYMLCV